MPPSCFDALDVDDVGGSMFSGAIPLGGGYVVNAPGIGVSVDSA